MSRQGEKRENTYDNIREFWDREADEIGSTPQVTIRDHFFRLHELQTLLTVIPSCDRLLDVGCGTGFGTVILGRRAEHATGSDYSPVMIEWAKRLLTDHSYLREIAGQLSPLWPMDGGGNVSFRVDNIVDLRIDEPRFDVITGQRILINLPTHEEQMKALENLRGVATDDATLILVEATRQGHAATDAYRLKNGVPALEKYWHNCYVDESKYDEWPSHGWHVQQRLSFDTYMLLSKVIYPASVGPENCTFLSGVNQAAMEIASIFRTRAATQEIGEASVLRMWTDRIDAYSPEDARRIRTWLQQNPQLDDWAGLGHQRLIIARTARS
jgi:SAM-dependent methyltransferase